MYVCMCKHDMCACIHLCMGICVHVWMSKDNLRCQSSTYTFFGTWSLCCSLLSSMLAGPDTFQGFSCLCLLSGYRNTGTLPSLAVHRFGGIQTQLLLLVEQVLYLLNHLSCPIINALCCVIPLVLINRISVESFKESRISTFMDNPKSYPEFKPI